MVQWVYQQAQRSGASRILVATDDRRIATAVEAFGGEAVLTSMAHPSGTDRLQEAAQRVSLSPQSIVVNVQGDEPLIPPEVILQVVGNIHERPEVAVATLSEPIKDEEDFKNPHIVKVVSDGDGRALYFSRAPIPWPRDHYLAGGQGLPVGFTPQRHLGIYAYRVGELDNFISWPEAPLEQLERLEQLRFLWNGAAIHVAESCVAVPGGVDTEEDLQRVHRLMGAQQ